MPFAIDDLASVIAHWSADAITGLSDGDPVDTLPDSVSGWDLTGATTTRPLYRPTGLASLPSVEFDGSDDWMVTGASKSLAAVGVSWISVLIIDTAKNSHAVGALDAGASLPTLGAASMGLHTLVYANTGIDTYRRDAANSQNLRCYTGGGSAYVHGQVVMLTHILAPSGWMTRVNGAGRLTSTGVTAVAEGLNAGSYYFSVGATSTAGQAFDGDFSEGVLFAETEQCESRYIEGVLAHKYGITLPTSHPFYAAAPSSGPSSGSVRAVNIRGGADQ